MTPFRLAWLNLIRHRGMTTLAILTLALTVGCAGMLLRLRHLADARFASMAQAGDAIIGPKTGEVETLLGCLNLEGGYPTLIPFLLYQTLTTQYRVQDKDTTNVSAHFIRQIVPVLFFAKYKEYRIMGTTAAFIHQPDPGPHVEVAQGRWPGPDDEVALGADVAKREHLKVGDDIFINSWISDDPRLQSVLPYRFKVCGILSPMHNAWDGALYSDLVTAYLVLNRSPPENSSWGPYVLHYMILYLRPGGMEKLQLLVDQRTVAQVTPVLEARRLLDRLTGSGSAAGAVVVFLALCLGGFSMAGLMLGRFESRSRELAALSAMGFRPRDLRAVLIWEGFLLGTAACLLGGLLDGVLFPLLRVFLEKALPSSVPSHVWESWPVWTVALSAMVLSSALLFLLLSRGHPKERLRSLS